MSGAYTNQVAGDPTVSRGASLADIVKTLREADPWERLGAWMQLNGFAPDLGGILMFPADAKDVFVARYGPPPKFVRFHPHIRKPMLVNGTWLFP